jgi:hypothetical protein
MRSLFIVMVMLLGLCSCRTVTQVVEREVPVEVEKIKTEYVNAYKYDSIAQKDSIDRYTRNDTTFIYREKILYKYKYYTDTIRTNDTIQVPVTITNTTVQTKEVNKLYWWQTFLIYLGLGLVAYGIFRVYKFFKK